MSLSYVNSIHQLANELKDRGIIHLVTEDNSLKGNRITLQGRDLVHFGSCSYLGLEFDQRMIEAAKLALDDYGTQFSSSRAYVSMRHYKELESNMDQIFGHRTIITPTTTLGHISAIPVLIDSDDAVILDHQVHNSVHMAVSMVKARGTHVELVRHNRMEHLEERMRDLSTKHRKVWYMADGVYSMFGDTVPLDDVYRMLDTYSNMHFYVDDAHGMSCFGQHGRGYVLSQKNMHPRMILATSLAKAYATGGAVLVFPDEATHDLVRNVGGPLITSGPLQPANLGAALAASQIHLSDDIYSLQDELHDNIRYTNLMVKEMGLPVVTENLSPVFFIPASLPKVAYNLINRLKDDGYFLNLGSFPAVPIKNTGIRFTITRLHNFEQIEGMISRLAHHFPKALKDEGFSIQEIYKAFRMEAPESVLRNFGKSEQLGHSLKVERHQSIRTILPCDWNPILGERGGFDHHCLGLMEDVFSNNILPEENWDFDYVIVRDKADKIVLATFFTTSLSKDDMLAPAAVSEIIEEKRQSGDPYYLCSRLTVCGSLLTEGDHIYIDRQSPNWKDALQLLFKEIDLIEEERQSMGVNLRDIDTQDQELSNILAESGYFKIDLPLRHSIDLSFRDEEDYYMNRLSQRSRKHYRHDVKNHEHKYELKEMKGCSPAERESIIASYRAVKSRNLGINTFDLPEKLFDAMLADSQWHIMGLYLKEGYNEGNPDLPVAVMFSYLTSKVCNFTLIGFDSNTNKAHNVYRQGIARIIHWAHSQGMQELALGFGSDFEKHKLGSQTTQSSAFMQLKDHYNLEVIGSMAPALKAR
jgi:7-keto-8-aminopelargonate synthetase-like enzyme